MGGTKQKYTYQLSLSIGLNSPAIVAANCDTRKVFGKEKKNGTQRELNFFFKKWWYRA